MPHPYTGEAVKAYVVPRAGSHLTPSDVTAFVATRLARFKWPTIIELVDALPHSATGKVAKGRLRERAGDVTRGVRLLTRPGCHLCDDARNVVAAVCAELGVGWDEVDITTDPALLAEYVEQIPVTLVDGRQHDFWRVDPDRLRAALG